MIMASPSKTMTSHMREAVSRERPFELGIPGSVVGVVRVEAEEAEPADRGAPGLRTRLGG